METPPNQPPPQTGSTPRESRGLLGKIVLFVVVLIIIAGIAVFILYLLYPGWVGLFFSAVGAVANSPSQNSTFSAAGVNFNYPANWISVNTSLFASALSNQSNTSSSKFGNKSQVAVIIPASEALKPSFLSQLLMEYLSNPTSFLPPSDLAFVTAGAASVFNKTFPLGNAILEVDPNASLINTSIGGYSGVHATFFNQTILSVTEYFAELSAAEVNGSLCFVFGYAGQKNDVATVNQSFNRVAQSLKCDFSKVGTSLPPSLLDKFWSILA